MSVTELTAKDRTMLAKIMDKKMTDDHSWMWALEMAFMAGKSAGLGFASGVIRGVEKAKS